VLKGKGVRAAADGITPRSFELLVHFWENGRSNLERYDLCGSVDILAEELAKKEKQVSHPAKTAHRVLRSGQAGIRDDRGGRGEGAQAKAYATGRPSWLGVN